MLKIRAVLLLVLAALLAVASFNVAHVYFQSEEVSKAQGRLSLYRSTVIAEIERFSHLTFVLARDPFVIETAQGGDTAALDVRLADFADQAGIDAIYLMDRTGLTVSASNATSPSSFVGQNYAFRPYFQNAMEGEQARFYGIGATTGLPGYFISDAVKNDNQSTLGVVALKIDLSKLEQSWRDAGERVLLTNEQGVVLLASDPDWRYQTLFALSEQQRSDIEGARQFPGQSLDRLDWSPTDGNAARIAGADWIHIMSNQLPHEWQLHYFAPKDRVLTQSWLVTAALVFICGMALVIFQIQRAKRMSVALQQSTAEEIALREANERLANEIDVRRRAERQLQRTQSELQRAGRLAALGQLSASVTHELGQPIAAMRNHLAAASLGGNATTGTMTKIGGLVDRMEGITRQLKFFARTEGEAFTDVNLAQAMHASLELVAPNLAETGIKVTFGNDTEPPWVRGNSLRIEQVMTNLLRNAIDAMEDTKGGVISICFSPDEQGEQDEKTVWFEIEDSGHGLGDATLADLQEPFVTTRESGQGMGLGLAISAGIVSDHGGHMTARNKSTNGAVFRVTFPANEGEDDV
ncbi:MAG: ATP-binding protein [Paracoccaceae bacterium]